MHTGTASEMVPISSYDSYTQLSDLCESMQQLGIPTERYSTDVTRTNGYGKKLLEMCKNNMMFVFNGKLGEDTMIGKETTVLNTVDWFIISCDHCENFQVLKFDPLLSDVHHCISFSIPTNRNVK